jgi:hypothetical protein
MTKKKCLKHFSSSLTVGYNGLECLCWTNTVKRFVFAPGKPFQPRLMFVGKDKSLPCLAILADIRLSVKVLPAQKLLLIRNIRKLWALAKGLTFVSKPKEPW